MAQKPMLADHITDINKIRFPVLASRKLDGLRATVQEGQLLSRSLKPLPNVHVQERFKGLPDGLDGELIVGNPTAKDAFRKTESLVMSDDKIEGLKDLYLWTFDRLPSPGNQVSFTERLASAYLIADAFPLVKKVEHIWVTDVKQLEALEEKWLDEGNEGVMVRDPNGLYKNGRSTEKQGILLKLKRMLDSEAIIDDSYEQMHNDNDEFTNELGRTARSREKAGLVPMGVLGGFFVHDVKTGVEFKVGSGFDAAERETIWSNKDSYIGKQIKYQYFPTGSKEKPRHPVFLGFRDARDTGE